MLQLDASLLFPAGDHRGECPVWDPFTAELLWTDTGRHRLWRLPDNATEAVATELDRRLCAFAVADNGQLLAAFDDGLGLLDRHSGQVVWLTDVEADRPHTRCSTGRADRHGNFVFGTMAIHGFVARGGSGNGPAGAGVGGFHHWSARRGLTPLYRSARAATGLCFAPDGLTVHYADAVRGTIWRAHYHPQHALFLDDEVLVAPGQIVGDPGGAAIDIEGNIWSARWGGSGVVCIDPGGTPIAFVSVPVTHVTACCFGGPNLDRLYITTAGEPTADGAADRSTGSAGGVWVAEPGTTGPMVTPVVTGTQASAATVPAQR